MINIPTAIEEDGNQRICTDIFSRLLTDRIILLNGEINDEVVPIITAQLLYLDAHESNRPIYIYINSPGGFVSAGMAIYDTMRFVKSSITTLCLGTAASMGAFLLSGGTPGQRYALPHSQIMVHQPSGGYSGQVTDIEIYTKQMLYFKKTLNNLMARHAGRSEEEIKNMCERDKFLTPEEAKEIGIIDKIITSREDISKES